MKKQNILDLLIDDYILRDKKEKENLYNNINEKEIDINIKKYIMPFLEQNYKLFDLNFDYNINSNDPDTKYKSINLLSKTILGVYDLIKTMPNYYKEYENQYNSQTAYNEICFRVLLGNIITFKKEINKISEEDKIILDNIKEIIDKI